MSVDLSPVLEEIYTEAQICRPTVLADLRQSATQFVRGTGPLDAEVMFIGEAPGADEDDQGRPFVGRSGQLLDELLATVGMARDDVFITNVVKYRPPENRKPRYIEIGASMECLEEEIDLVDPKVIVTLGATPLQALLPECRISRDHGTWHTWRWRRVLPLYHPAYILRNPDERSVMEDDFARLTAVPS